MDYKIEATVTGYQVSLAGVGAQGGDGKSAYLAAVEGGYTGTEAEFYTLLSTFEQFAADAQVASTSAATSATNAADSAMAAATSAATATTKATVAATSATNAAASATTASSAALSADSSKAAAASSATAASAARVAAETAKTAAETAKTAAETAKTAAETARTGAEAAKAATDIAAATAVSARNTATTAAVAAEAARDAAATSATSATASSTLASSKATDAANSVGAALNSATAAATSATNAATSATNASGSATTASNAASTASNMASVTTTKATEASASATAAATSATSASAGASTATVKAAEALASANEAANIAGTVGVSSASVDGTGHLLITRNNNTVLDAGYVVGPVGPTGSQGEIGPQGIQGDKGDSFTVDATGLFVGRSAYDAAPEDFSYLSTDTGELYIRQGVSGWSDAVPFGKGDTGATGPVGPAGPAGTTTWTGITDRPAVIAAGATQVEARTAISLDNVDNTSDLTKPISTATQTALDSKAWVVHTHSVATNLDAGFMSAIDKVKLDGIAESASNYTHPANHPPSIITQDASNRFVTDAEKATWNAKQPAGNYATGGGTATGVNTGDQTDITGNAGTATALSAGADRTKLDGIAESANNYVHPANHPPSIITQDASNRFVTDAEKATWNAKQSSLVSGVDIKTVNGGTLLGAGNVVVGDATLTGVQTLTNKTFTGYTETVYNLTGTDIAVANGSIQTKTLAANTTFTESLADGQSVILGITAGAYSVTWPSVTWSKVGGGGAAPTLTSTGVNWVVLWQVGGVVRGSFLGTA